MAAKNSVKQYLESGYYHLYNRGVEKREIFLDKQDYFVFLSYLKQYLIPKNELELLQKIGDKNLPYVQKDKYIKMLKLNNFYGEIYLLAFTLMPNHFHLLLKQSSSNTIDKFMNSLCTRYSMYFNKKYKRVGRLYQDVYKAVLVESNEQLLHLSRYIHRQAISPQSPQADPLQGWQEMQPTSFSEYLGLRNTPWLFPDEILSFFSKENSQLSYESFVKQNDEFERINKLMIEVAEE